MQLSKAHWCINQSVQWAITCFVRYFNNKYQSHRAYEVIGGGNCINPRLRRCVVITGEDSIFLLHQMEFRIMTRVVLGSQEGFHLLLEN